MDKHTLNHLLKILPDDATEISIPRHDSNEVLFNSDLITKDNADKIGAIPTQKGTYRGPKKRWRVTVAALTGGFIPIPLDTIPHA